MAQFRRTALIAFSLAAVACMRATPPAAAGISVENGTHPGEFAVTNHGTGPVDLLRKVTVEVRGAGKWAATDADVSLVASCSDKSATSSVTLASRQTLKVAPWNGMTCDGQCPRSCRANVSLGPGEFRFVVWTADRKTRFEGLSFHMPGPSR
jgi:hypothetical protein